MNYLVLDGVIGRITQQKSETHVVVSFCHRRAWYDEKEDEWKQEDNWISANFFGGKALRLKQNGRPGLHIIVEGSVFTFPKVGPQQQLRINGKSYRLFEHIKDTPSYAKEEN